jgi:hypothetical protein
MVESTASLAPPLRIALGVPAGVLATLAMDVAMARLPAGEGPPKVAASVLTKQPLDAAPARLATVVHYVAGLLTGPLFVTLLLFGEALVGVGPLAYAISGAALYVLMVGFFQVVPLPLADAPAERRSQVGRAWAVEALVYVVVVVPLAWVGAEAVGLL